ncbi:small ribosomal subunit Rsm22 family protein [Haloparvum sp. AD34]
MIDRDAVRNNAKYLRNVRPIDPEEIAEYVPGGAHPAVVRQTLREEAYDLALRETDEGTFVPVDDDPVPQPGWQPREFPEPYSIALENLLVEEYGANWHRGDSGDRLREAIRKLKEDYYYENEVAYDHEAALGYAIYHLPDYYAAIGYVLDDLTENALLDRTIRVLDVGAGTGGPALGLHDYLPDDAVVDYHAIEPSAAADVLTRLLEETGRNFHETIHRETAQSFFGLDADGSDADEEANADSVNEPFDLVLFGNVLSEIEEPVPVVEAGIDALADDGTVVGLAPADLNTATGLREIEREVAPPDGDVTVYSPTLRLWPDAAPSDRGWSFDVKPDLEVPAFQHRLDEAATRADEEDLGEFRNVDVQYAYAILRTDGERRVDVRADPQRQARMADSEEYVTDRINLLAVKLSHDLADGGNPLFKIGDGSESVEHYAVSTRETSLNRDLLEADYGSILYFENALVLWNDDEGAYNVVVDDEVLIDLVAP